MLSAAFVSVLPPPSFCTLLVLAALAAFAALAVFLTLSDASPLSAFVFFSFVVAEHTFAPLVLFLGLAGCPCCYFTFS